ncbi:phytanoyl-CoA dioxygenase family protein [Williamsia phyllosphaerae]|uniref:Phytanoyl-CoA dioxygenase n=1 Tax=Williamsia phyllosphaerae TaxID=885042 RepID=A0ABQ1US46_9NOCA|nr:phytanoyl-CoA dioxygenase family protein [Williamsia phyllosphaerae]GGF24105.1 phytanoyl-CoA dioxygenase [Williamsia phyllosphaerae]
MTLTSTEIETFVRDGFVAVRGAVDRPTIDECRRQLWDLVSEDPTDPNTWTEPVRRMDSPITPAFTRAAQAAALTEAYDQLVGPGRWQRRVELGNVAIRFPADTESNDTGWHIDASYLPPDASRHFVNVSSRDRGLLMLFLISDVCADDAPTRLKVGSHQDVPRFLAPYGDGGVDMFELCGVMDAAGALDSPDRGEAVATGAAGDVFLCHPFLVHAAQSHHGTQPRFLSQPGLMLTDQFDLGNPWSPVERAIVASL